MFLLLLVIVTKIIFLTINSLGNVYDVTNFLKCAIILWVYTLYIQGDQIMAELIKFLNKKKKFSVKDLI